LSPPALIALSIFVFTGTVELLVWLLTVAESRLVAKSGCKLVINDSEEEALTVPAGRSVLSTLSAEGIFVPSACGGKGTCGACKCQVHEGGGDVLATELPHFTKTELREHYRLACQVKVKQDMRIRVPEEIFSIRRFECTVRSNHNVATFIKELVLELPAGESMDFRAGGYVQIDIPPYEVDYAQFDIETEYRPDWDKYNLWQFHASNQETIFRAYSMANHPAEGSVVMLNVRIASPPPRQSDVPPGIATSYIFNLKPGDKVSISGPYGEFFAKDTDREMLYIGGGAGMAPMRSHLFHLFHTLRTGREVSFWYGARSRREMFYDDDFKAIQDEFPNFRYTVALSEPLPEDNWDGPVGFIHQVVHDHYLAKHEAPEDLEYYLCGPPMMIDAVNKMLYDLGVDGEMIAYDSFG
jgi:Na+-transporting NADH:ubiquinone oxidoreductase subunit F